MAIPSDCADVLDQRIVILWKLVVQGYQEVEGQLQRDLDYLMQSIPRHFLPRRIYIRDGNILRLYKEVLNAVVKYLIFLGWSVEYITHALSRDNDDILRRPVMDESITFRESRLWNLLPENALGSTFPC